MRWTASCGCWAHITTSVQPLPSASIVPSRPMSGVAAHDTEDVAPAGAGEIPGRGAMTIRAAGELPRVHPSELSMIVPVQERRPVVATQEYVGPTVVVVIEHDGSEGARLQS